MLQETLLLMSARRLLLNSLVINIILKIIYIFYSALIQFLNLFKLKNQYYCKTPEKIQQAAVHGEISFYRIILESVLCFTFVIIIVIVIFELFKNWHFATFYKRFTGLRELSSRFYRLFGFSSGVCNHFDCPINIFRFDNHRFAQYATDK